MNDCILKINRLVDSQGMIITIDQIKEIISFECIRLKSIECIVDYFGVNKCGVIRNEEYTQIDYEDLEIYELYQIRDLLEAYQNIRFKNA